MEVKNGDVFTNKDGSIRAIVLMPSEDGHKHDVQVSDGKSVYNVSMWDKDLLEGLIELPRVDGLTIIGKFSFVFILLCFTASYSKVFTPISFAYIFVKILS